MGCAGCANNGDGSPAGCRSNGSCGNGGCNKLTVFNWLSNMEMPNSDSQPKYVEVRFKNGRKNFYINDTDLQLYDGDAIAVQADTGHDVGVVCLSGELVRLQMKKKGVFHQTQDLKKVYRKANEKDIDDWQTGRAKEADAMIKSRSIASELGLKMKISDVEYQADLSKATFYYTAEERVDFRALIRKLADTFKVRIEMKQIGMRQEAGKLGGIGSCGRELCCSTWLTDFRSVSTSAARYQQLSLNPSKLAGQCGKLKCCLNYELDAYMDELKKFPDTKKNLKTRKGEAFFQKMDIFSNKMWYSYKENPSEFIELSLDRVIEVIENNKKGKAVEDLKNFANTNIIEQPEYANVVGQDSLTRFDNKGNRSRNRNRNKRRKQNQNKRKN
tara:strand:+ start:390 stop:1547 length:1158 start_codon:yes stop_codon:yes gene_type:complete